MNISELTAAILLKLLDREYKITELRSFGDSLAAKRIIEILVTVYPRKFE